MRASLIAWEFWVPPTLAMIAVACIVWLLNHNQTLIHQRYIDQAALFQMHHADGQIEALKADVARLRETVEYNKVRLDDLDGLR